MAVIGDSTFLHSGITGLLDIVYNRGACTVIILDNRITAMTGRQEHPGTGYTLQGQETKASITKCCAGLSGLSISARSIHMILKQVKEVISEEVNRPEPSVIISEAAVQTAPPESKQPPVVPYTVEEDLCRGCRACLQIGCPALEWKPAATS